MKLKLYFFNKTSRSTLSIEEGIAEVAFPRFLVSGTLLWNSLWPMFRGTDFGNTLLGAKRDVLSVCALQCLRWVLFQRQSSPERDPGERGALPGAFLINLLL